jgi:hypothetical protein
MGRLVLNVILSAERNLLLALSLPFLKGVSTLQTALLLKLCFAHLELVDLLHPSLTLQLCIANELHFFFRKIAFDRARWHGAGWKRYKTV